MPQITHEVHFTVWDTRCMCSALDHLIFLLCVLSTNAFGKNSNEPQAKCIRLTFHMCTFSTFTTFHAIFHSTRLHYMLLLSAGKLLHIIFISFESAPSNVRPQPIVTERLLFHFQAFNLLMFCLRQFHEYIYFVYSLKLRLYGCAASPFQCE